MGVKISKNDRPLFLSPVYAGFPGVVEDKIDRNLDLNDYCVTHPAATFYVKSSGFSMVGVGIGDGDILVVDRSLDARNNSIVIATIDGEFTVKRILKSSRGVSLMPENPMYSPIKVSDGMDFEVWGVVTHVIKKFL